MTKKEFEEMMKRFSTIRPLLKNEVGQDIKTGEMLGAVESLIYNSINESKFERDKAYPIKKNSKTRSLKCVKN